MLLETGIEVIDVLVPLGRGRSVGLFGGERVGTTVVVEELVRRLATQALSLFTFLPSVTAAGLRHVRDEGHTLGIGGVQTLFFRGDGRGRQDAFDSLIVLCSAVVAAVLHRRAVHAPARHLRGARRHPAACEAIVDGAHDQVPEEAFYFAGGIDEVLARR